MNNRNRKKKKLGSNEQKTFSTKIIEENFHNIKKEVPRKVQEDYIKPN